MRGRYGRALGIFLLAMLALTLLSRAGDALMLPEVRLGRPKAGPLTHRASLSGPIEADGEFPVMAERDFAVMQVHVRRGQEVAAGDRLFSYDLTVIEAALMEKQEKLRKAVLQGQFDALGEGEEKKDASKEKKDALKRQIAQIELEALQREVDHLARLMGAGGVEVAPVAGIVSALDVSPGGTPQGAALRIADAGMGLVVRTKMDEQDAKHFSAGAKAGYRRSGQSRTQEGAVLMSLAPNADGYEASFAVPGSADAIGQTVHLELAQKTGNYDLCVPLSALAKQDGADGVYRIGMRTGVLGEQAYAEFVPVDVLDRDGQYAAIQCQLSTRDQIIFASAKPLQSGDRVREGDS